MPENIYPIVKFIPGGVYRLLFPSGKSYIGQAKNIEERHKFYKNGNCEKQPILCSALKKYGWNNVKKEVLIYTNQLVERNFWEKWYIMQFDSMKNGYNCTMGGEGIEGYIHTKEARLKISQVQKGKKRKPFTKEHIQKISDSNKGKLRSKETRKNMSNAHKGIPLSEEHIKNISIANIGLQSGKNHPMYGKRQKDETKLKMSNSHKGKIFTEEHKRNIKLARKAYFQKRKLNTQPQADTPQFLHCLQPSTRINVPSC